MNTNKDILLDEISDDGASEAKFIKSYGHLLVEVITTGFTGTLKFLGSLNDGSEKPDLSQSASLTNPYAPVQVKDLEDGSGKNGNEGLSYTADTSVAQYEVNTNRICWFGAVASDVSGGTLSVKLVGVVEK